MGASILPITIHNGKIYFLFGKERPTDINPGWSDFGGGTDNNESFMETAIREGGEELTGFLGTGSDIKKMLNKHGTFIVDLNSNGHGTYRVHIFPMEYNPFLVEYYNNYYNFIKTKLDHNFINDENVKIFEKPQIKWWSFSEIKQKRSQFRSFYRNVIDMILERRSEISAFVHSKIKVKHPFKKTMRKKCCNCKKRCNCKKQCKTMRRL